MTPTEQAKTMSMVERLRKCLSYDPLTGDLTWIGGWIRFRGKTAGTINGHGYVQVGFEGRLYNAHRLIWMIVYGVEPAQIDHINGIRSDNRLSNLRECEPFENQQNLPPRTNTLTGFPGVTFDKRRARFMAKIKSRGRTINLGYFDDARLAHVAYLNAKRDVHTFSPLVRGLSSDAALSEEGE